MIGAAFRDDDALDLAAVSPGQLWAIDNSNKWPRGRSLICAAAAATVLATGAIAPGAPLDWSAVAISQPLTSVRHCVPSWSPLDFGSDLASADIGAYENHSFHRPYFSPSALLRSLAGQLRPLNFQSRSRSAWTMASTAFTIDSQPGCQPDSAKPLPKRPFSARLPGQSARRSLANYDVAANQPLPPSVCDS